MVLSVHLPMVIRLFYIFSGAHVSIGVVQPHRLEYVQSGKFCRAVQLHQIVDQRPAVYQKLGQHVFLRVFNGAVKFVAFLVFNVFINAQRKRHKIFQNSILSAGIGSFNGCGVCVLLDL